MAKSKMAAGQT